MSEISYEFERFSSREGFNRSLMHFKAVSGMLGEFEHLGNLGDTLNRLLLEKEVEQVQLGPILYALLVDKYGYHYRSYNMEESFEDFAYIAEETRKWNSVDLVLSYFHPELGLLVVNPKNAGSWEKVNSLKKNEIVTIYAGAFAQTSDAKDPKIFDDAIDKIVEYLQGRKSAASAKLKSGKLKYVEPKIKPAAKPAKATPSRGPRERAARRNERGPAPSTAPALQPRFTGAQAAASETRTAPAAAAAPQAQPAAPAQSGAKRMTPFYSVPVTNELFHNGNVEAWKKIIQSYTTKYPGLDVYVFYDGERIHDIHALFKWGKVKHGSTILFAVAGENIQDVAKLQRYLRQGASPRFEDFLRFPVNTVLKLF